MSKYNGALKVLNSSIDKEVLRNKLTKLVANETTGEVSKENLRIIGFLVNNHKSYLRTMELNAISVIEAIQAHYIARFLKDSVKVESCNASRTWLLSSKTHLMPQKMTNNF